MQLGKAAWHDAGCLLVCSCTHVIVWVGGVLSTAGCVCTQNALAWAAMKLNSKFSVGTVD